MVFNQPDTSCVSGGVFYPLNVLPPDFFDDVTFPSNIEFPWFTKIVRPAVFDDANLQIISRFSIGNAVRKVF